MENENKDIYDGTTTIKDIQKAYNEDEYVRITVDALIALCSQIENTVSPFIDDNNTSGGELNE